MSRREPNEVERATRRVNAASRKRKKASTRAFDVRNAAEERAAEMCHAAEIRATEIERKAAAEFAAAREEYERAVGLGEEGDD